MRIRDPESFWPWIRDGKIRIRDKHPGSATLGLKICHYAETHSQMITPKIYNNTFFELIRFWDTGTFYGVYVLNLGKSIVKPHLPLIQLFLMPCVLQCLRRKPCIVKINKILILISHEYMWPKQEELSDSPLPTVFHKVRIREVQRVKKFKFWIFLNHFLEAGLWIRIRIRIRIRIGSVFIRKRGLG